MLDKLEELNNKIDYDNLKYVVERSDDEYIFIKIKDPIALLNNIKKGKLLLEEAKEKQKGYHKYLNTIRKGNKNANQKRTLANINIFINVRDNAIKFIEDYSSMILEAKNWQKNKKEQDLKY